MKSSDNKTYGNPSTPQITWSTQHIGGDTYMVTKTTIEMFTIKIPK